MKRSISLFSLILSALLTGCLSFPDYKDEINTWVGYDKESLIKEWGKPYRERKSFDGSEVSFYASQLQRCPVRFDLDVNDIVVKGYYYGADGCRGTIKLAPANGMDIKAARLAKLEEERLAKEISGQVEKQRLLDQQKQALSAVKKINNSSILQWRFKGYVGEMDSIARANAVGRTIRPRTQLDFPYNQVAANLQVECAAADYMYAYINFNVIPNLAMYSDGDRIPVKFKWDDEIIDGEIFHSAGNKYVRLAIENYSKPIIDRIESSGKLTLFLDWYGSSSYFDFPLNGSAKMIDSLKAACYP